MSEPKAWFYEDGEFKSVSLYRDALQGEAIPLYKHPKNEWIKVENELPNELELVFVFADMGSVYFRDFVLHSKGQFFRDNKTIPFVTHWMRLPESPKEIQS